MAFIPADLYKPEVLSGVVELRAEEAVTYDLGDFAPIVPTKKRKVKVVIREGTRSRIGQFRADNALTPVSVPRTASTEVEIDIPMQSEKEIIQEHLLVLLSSPDMDIARQTADLIVDNGARLREQNINLSRWMVWKALQDELTITYPNGAFRNVDYLLSNSDSRMVGSHKLTTGVTWANPASDIIGDMKAWKKRISDDYGQPAKELRLSTTVWNYIQDNTAIQKRVGTVAAPQTPDDPSQVARIFGLDKIVIYDEVYEDSAGVVQRYFPEGRIFLTAKTGRTAGGRVPLIMLLDAPVARYNNSTGRVDVGNNTGAVTEIWATPEPPEENIRVTTARMPMFIRQGVVCAQVLI